MRTKDENKTRLIFEAAVRLIKQTGVGGLTMARLAKEADIATGTLYIYFKNKEELLNELYQTLRKETMDRFFLQVDPSEPYKICLKKVWMNYLKHRIEYYEESFFLEQFYHSAFITPEQKALAEDMKKPVYDLIERGKKEQIIKNYDKEILFSSMLGFLRELVADHIEGRYILNEERIEQGFQVTWDSLKT